MKKLLIGAMVCLSLAAFQSCKKQVIEEREDIVAGSEIISQGVRPTSLTARKATTSSIHLPANFMGLKPMQGGEHPYVSVVATQQKPKYFLGQGHLRLVLVAKAIGISTLARVLSTVLKPITNGVAA